MWGVHARHVSVLHVVMSVPSSSCASPCPIPSTQLHMTHSTAAPSVYFCLIEGAANLTERCSDVGEDQRAEESVVGSILVSEDAAHAAMGGTHLAHGSSPVGASDAHIQRVPAAATAHRTRHRVDLHRQMRLQSEPQQVRLPPRLRGGTTGDVSALAALVNILGTDARMETSRLLGRHLKRFWISPQTTLATTDRCQ
jgi:hypothetical protein